MDQPGVRYKIVLWDVDPLDWKTAGRERGCNRIVKNTRAGSIVLAHDNSSRYHRSHALRIQRAGSKRIQIRDGVRVDRNANSAAAETFADAETLNSAEIGARKIEIAALPFPRLESCRMIADRYLQLKGELENGPHGIRSSSVGDAAFRRATRHAPSIAARRQQPLLFVVVGEVKSESFAPQCAFR